LRARQPIENAVSARRGWQPDRPAFGCDNFPSVLFVPHGYSSGAVLSGSLTWNNASFASLGVTRATYTWTWDTGAEQSFTLIIGNTVNASEPGALGMFGLGVLMIGAFVGLRRRVA